MVLCLIFVFSAAVVISNIAFAQNGSWTTKAPMPTARYGPAVGVISGKLYVAAGCCTQFVPPFGRFNNLEVYDPANNTWTTKAPIPLAVYASPSGVLGGKLYMAGGQASQTDGTNRADLQVYDPMTDSWTSRASLPFPSAAGAAGVISGQLYVAGGMNPGNTASVNSLRVYDPATNVWTSKTSMSVNRAAAGGAVVSGILYVAGGLGTVGELLNSVEAYDPVSDTWSTRAPMPTARYGVGAEVINGLIYIVGGTDGTNSLSTVEVYNPNTNTWTTDASMTTVRGFPGVGVVNNILYAVGGYSSPSTLLDSLEAFTPTPACVPPPPNMVTGTDAAGNVALGNGNPFKPFGTWSRVF